MDDDGHEGLDEGPDEDRGEGLEAGHAGQDSLSGGRGEGGAEGGRGGVPGSGGAAPDAGSAQTDAGSEPLDWTPCPPAEPCRVMPLGDSITEAFQYRVALFRKAKAAGRNMTFVGSKAGGPILVDGVSFPRQHEGHSGIMVDGLSGLVPMSLSQNRPHIVLLMIGTNDAHRSSQAGTAPARVGALVDTIAARSPEALIVVAKIIPTKDDPSAMYYAAGNDPRVRSFNAALEPVLEARREAGKHVITVDMYAAFTANPNYKTAYMADHLHPNGAGFEVMAGVWWDAISPFLRHL